MKTNVFLVVIAAELLINTMMMRSPAGGLPLDQRIQPVH
jgi:hypothetical protein